MCEVLENPDNGTNDQPKTVLLVAIKDPEFLDSQGHPTTRAILHVLLAGKLSDILAHNSRPKSEIVDDFIEEMSLDTILPIEKKAGVSMEVVSACAYCGSALGVSSCPGCHAEYAADPTVDGWKVPLTGRMEEFIMKKGICFMLDPKMARFEEMLAWEED